MEHISCDCEKAQKQLQDQLAKLNKKMPTIDRRASKISLFKPRESKINNNQDLPISRVKRNITIKTGHRGSVVGVPEEDKDGHMLPPGLPPIRMNNIQHFDSSLDISKDGDSSA